MNHTAKYDKFQSLNNIADIHTILPNQPIHQFNCQFMNYFESSPPNYQSSTNIQHMSQQNIKYSRNKPMVQDSQNHQSQLPAFTRSLPMGPILTQEIKSRTDTHKAPEYHKEMVRIAQEKEIILKVKSDGSNCPSISEDGYFCDKHAFKHFWCYQCKNSFKYRGNSNITNHLRTKAHHEFTTNHIELSINKFTSFFLFFFVDRQQLLFTDHW